MSISWNTDQDLSELETILSKLENEAGVGATSCVTFGLTASTFMEGTTRLRQEAAAAANIRSRL